MLEKILFVCIGNSCRSQMAEGFTNKLLGNKYQAFSAGIRPSKLDPLTVEVMKELDIDISKNSAKTLAALDGIAFDYVVTVCGAGAINCPVIEANKKRISLEFDDPPALTIDFKSKEEKLVIYRKVRDEIHEFISNLESNLTQS